MNKNKIQKNPQNIHIPKILGDFVYFAFKEPYTAI